MPHRMDRMVSFRLPAEDYQKFKLLCANNNCRSLSDLARTAMQHWLRYGFVNNAVNFEDRIGTLEQRLADLSSELHRHCSNGGH